MKSRADADSNKDQFNISFMHKSKSNYIYSNNDQKIRSNTIQKNKILGKKWLNKINKYVGHIQAEEDKELENYHELEKTRA